MAEAIIWPCDVLKPRNRAVNPVYRSVSGGIAVNGFSQVVASDAGIWKATFDGIWIRTANQVKAWRAVRSHAEGRLNPILICVCEGSRKPIASGVPSGEAGGQVPHSDDALFSDNTGYVTGWSDAVASANAIQRAVNLSVAKGSYTTLEVGQLFSIDERLYEIKKINSQSSTTASIKIWPPLRNDVGSGERLEFDHPVLRVRLAEDSSMDLDLELNRFASPTVNFVEDL